jgi:hypothetical protein
LLWLLLRPRWLLCPERPLWLDPEPDMRMRPRPLSGLLCPLLLELRMEVLLLPSLRLMFRMCFPMCRHSRFCSGPAA